MNHKVEIINNHVGNRIMAPTIPPPPTITIPPSSTQDIYIPAPSINDFKQSSEKYIVDNGLLYKKLIDLEEEIKILTNTVNNLIPKQPYYPATYPSNYGTPSIPTSHNINYINMKPYQPNYL